MFFFSFCILDIYQNHKSRNSAVWHWHLPSFHHSRQNVQTSPTQNRHCKRKHCKPGEKEKANHSPSQNFTLLSKRKYFVVKFTVTSILPVFLRKINCSFAMSRFFALKMSCQTFTSLVDLTIFAHKLFSFCCSCRLLSSLVSVEFLSNFVLCSKIGPGVFVWSFAQSSSTLQSTKLKYQWSIFAVFVFTVLIVHGSGQWER